MVRHEYVCSWRIFVLFIRYGFLSIILKKLKISTCNFKNEVLI